MLRRDLADIAGFFRKLQWLVIVLAALWLLGKLAGVLTPFLLAALLGWLGDPLVDRLEARGMGRTRAFWAVYTGMILLPLLVLLALLPALFEQVGLLSRDLPRYAGWVMGTAVPWVDARLGTNLAAWLDIDYLSQWVRGHWTQVSAVVSDVLGIATRSGLYLAGLAVNLVLVPLLTYFFLRDWDSFVARLSALVPRTHALQVQGLVDESAGMLRAFMRGQFAVMLIMAVFNAIGLTVVGLNVGILIGVVSGLLSFVPYLGPTALLLAGSIAAMVQFGDWQHLLGVVVVWGLGQLIESYVITPKLVGDRIGLHPMAVIFAVMAGGVLFGFLGMLLALPVAAVVNVLMRHLLERYTRSTAYTGEPEGEPLIVVGGETGDVRADAAIAPQPLPPQPVPPTVP